MIARKVLFSLGDIVSTLGALNAFQDSGDDPSTYLARHQSGDWGGALSEEDKQANSEALSSGARILSAYYTSKGVKFWIITEADRSVTTFLLPEEY